LTERGVVTKIDVRSFVAGKLPHRLASVMSKLVVDKVKAFLASSEPETADKVEFIVDNVVEQNVQGSGAGLM
jgi:hypothetical protein